MVEEDVADDQDVGERLKVNRWSELCRTDKH